MSPETQFKKLFEPGQIGKMEVKNRICMAPMGTRYATDAGFVTGRQIDYYAERAKGGVGLIILEATYIHPYPGRMLISDEKFIPGLMRLTDAIHEAGAKVAVEIQTRRGRSDLKEPLCPSPVPHPKTGVMPRALTLDDMAAIKEAFGLAAERAKKAGFDAIQIHGASGYLLTEFLSPLANERTDQYGGSLENRARFATEIIARVRERVGPDYPIIYRQCGDEHAEGGIPLNEVTSFAQILERSSVDAIEVVSGSTVHSLEWIMLPLGFPKGANIHLSEGIKKAVNIPIITVGKVNDPYLAEDVLEKGQADFICIGKALIADPAFPRKTMEGKIDEIRPCIACLECQDKRLRDPVGVRCAVNPSSGRENVVPIRPAPKSRKVAVVGAGPAGIEAALTLSQKGHKVTLFDKQKKLGGKLLLDTISPYKEESEKLLNYFRKQLEKQGIGVKLGVEVTPKSAALSGMDAVVVATGGRAIVPGIPGAKGKNVLTAQQVLAGAKAGKKAVVIGSGPWGCKAAEFLAQKKKQVTLLETSNKVAEELEETITKVTVGRLKKLGVQMEAGVQIEGINNKGVKCIRNGSSQVIPADTVVLGIGLRPDLGLAEELAGKVPAVYSVGDCVKPRTLADPIESGFQEALDIL